MSAAETPVQDFGPEWCARRVITFAGQSDTHIDEIADRHGELTPNPHPRAGQPYDTITLAQVFTMQPGAVDKASSPAFIPSTYHGFDARNHARQREAGEFVALTGDIDTGNHSLEDVRHRVAILCREAAYLIYASAHSRPGDMRWRVVIPLAQPVDFDTWHDAQTGFFNYMERAGIDMDRALDRAGQPVYLPNVPEFHAKSGDRLRGEDGDPLYFERKTTGCNAPGLRIEVGPISSAIADVRRKREDDERERERIRKEAEQRRANRPRTDGAPIIDDFNRENSIAQMFELYGYEQSPRHAEDWRSPHQTSDSYATRIMGDKWISLSGSDAGSGLGEKCKAGCFGDAYDLFVHFEHGGNHKDAFRTLYSERRIASGTQNLSPPPRDESDPGWTEPPEGFDAEPVVEPVEVVTAELSADASPFHPELFDPDDLLSIPPRLWLVGHRLQRGKVTGGVAPGGVGKSAFCLTTALAILTGDRRLTGEEVHETGPVLLIYNEEDMDEVHRRIAALCKFWQIDPSKLKNLHLMCSVSGEVKLVTLDRNGSALVMPEVGLVTDYCLQHGIVYMCCDPFITFHTMPENDNTNVDIAARQFSRIAFDANVAIDLIHHISKGGDSESHAGDISRARGGGAIGAAIRNSYTLAAMSKETAEGYGLKDDYVRFVRLDDGKRNYSLRSGEPDWFYLESVEIANGDSVGVIRPFDFEEIERARNEAHAERLSIEKEQFVSTISGLMSVPEMPLKTLSQMFAREFGKSERWGRNAIESVVPPAPAKVETQDCNLWLERRGAAATAPIYAIKEKKL